MPNKNPAMTSGPNAPETAEAVQAWSPPENLHDLPKDETAPADHLHNYAQNYMGLSSSDQEANQHHLEELTSNPNLGPTTVKDLYQYLSAKNSPLNGEMMQNLVGHKNAPAEQIEDYLRRSNSRKSKVDESFRSEMGKRSGVSQKLLEDLTRDQIQDPEMKHYYLTHHDLKPEFAHQLLSERPIPEPEEGTMTEQQKTHNQRVQKIDSVVRHVLTSSTHHTPASLEAAVDFMTGDRPEGMDDFAKMRSGLVEKQKNLTARQLEKLFVPDNTDPEVSNSNEAIVKHPNVDPMFLSRIALDTVDDSYETRDTKSAARQNPSLPRETIERLIQNAPESEGSNWSSNPAEISGLDLTKNPALTKEDVQKLYDKGYKRALFHDNAPTSMLEKYWVDHGKSTDAARTLLQKPTLPESILKDMVNHKNQNVAIDALDHKSVNENVLEAAAKRKAPAVADKAAKNPLVAQKYIAERVSTGKMKGSEFLFGKGAQESLDPEKLPELYKTVNARYQNTSEEHINSLKESAKDFWNVKTALAQSPHLNAKERKENTDQIVHGFLDHVKPTDYRNLDRDHDSSAHVLSRKISELATSGNKEAQDALLERPQLFAGAVDVSNSAFDRSYLDKLAKKISENPKIQLTSRYRDNELEETDLAPVLDSIARNPNVSQKLFDNITLTNGFLESDHNYNLTSKDQTPDVETIFDRKFSDFPADKKRAAFSKLMKVGPEGSFAVASSKQSPKDMWHEAVMSLSPEKRKDFFRVRDVMEYADQSIRQHALRGTYNTSGASYGNSPMKPQEDALKSLKPGLDDEHLKSSLDFIKNGQENRMPEDDIYSSLADNYFDKEQGDKYVGMAYDHGPTLGSLAFAKVLKDSNDEIQANDIDNAIMKRFPDAGSGSGTYGHAWLEMLRAYDSGPTFNSPVKNLLRAKECDFLANMQSKGVDPDTAAAIRDAAVKHDLISENALSSLVVQDPSIFSQSMKSASKSTRAKTIQGLMSNQEISPEMAQAIIPYLDNSSFHPDSGSYIHRFARGRDDTKEKVAESFRNGTMKIIDSAIKNGQSETSGTALAKIVSPAEDVPPRRGGIGVTQKKQLVSEVLNAIKTGPYSDEQKNMARLSVYENLPSSFVPKSLMADVARSAIKTNDVNSLIRLSQNSDAPASALKQVAKLVDRADTLNDEQMESITSLISNKNTSFADIKKLYTACSNRLAQNDNPRLKATLFSNVAKMADDSEYSNDVIDRLRFGINYMKNASRDPQYTQEAQLNLYNYSMRSKLPIDDRRELVLSLPNDLPIDPTVAALNTELVNDPQILQNATSGWKLAALMNTNFHSLTNDSASVVVNRVVAQDPAQLPVSTLDFAKNVVGSENVNDEDAVKAIRFAGPGATREILSSLHNTFFTSDQMASSAVHNLFPIALKELNDLSDDESSTTNDYINNLSMTLGRLPSDSDAKMPAERQDQYDDAIHGLYDIAEKRLAIKSKDPEVKAKVLGNIFKLAQRTAASDRKHNEEDSGHRSLELVANARKQLEMMRDKGLLKESHMIQPGDLSSFTQGWVGNSIIKSDEEWMHAYDTMPELAFALDSAKDVIPAAAINQAKYPDQYFRDHGRSAFDYMSKLVEKVPKEGNEKSVKKILDSCLRNIGNQQEACSRVVANAIDSHPEVFSSEYLNDIKGSFDPNGNIWKKVREKALTRGVGGRPYVQSEIGSILENRESNKWKLEDISSALDSMIAVASSPHLTNENDKFFSEFLDADAIDAQNKFSIAESLAKNQKCPPEVMNSVVKFMDQAKMEMGKEYSRRLVAAVTNNPSVSKKQFFQLYESTRDQYPTVFEAGGKFHPALTNSQYGGDLFRSIKPTIPSEVKNVDENNLVPEYEHSVSKNRIKEALQHIPPEGIAWGQFKKVFPKAENWPEVKSMFMAKGGQKPILPEEAIEEMKKHEGNAFHITYSKWTGAQRHSDAKNLVVQLNTSKKMEDKLTSDPKLWKWYQFVQKSANHTQDGQLGGHPVTPHIASWIRVDTSGGKDGWIIEEFQSDFGARLYDQLQQLKRQQPEGADVDGEHYTVEEMEKYSKAVEDVLSSWYEASMDGIEQLAKKQGVSALHIHGEDVRASLSGMNKGKKNPVWMEKMYKREPPKRGYEKIDYSDYPNKNENFFNELKREGRETWCWRKRLA